MAQISFIKVFFTFPIIFYQNCIEPQGADCYTHLWNYNNKVVNCQGKWFMGQFGGSYEKVTLLLNYPQGRTMRFNFTMGKFNSWDYEPFYVIIDDVQVDSFTYGPFEGTPTSNLGFIILDQMVRPALRLFYKVIQIKVLMMNHGDLEMFALKFQILVWISLANVIIKVQNFSICSGNQTLLSKNVPFFIKSISLYDGMIVKFKDSKYFGGELQIYTQSQNCLPNYNFPKYKKPE
ncbi:unnamed protein product [Paramecium primaurelia]|uniref:Uncharacterized protein n=1 Tax=Paramecium primaurelia TaxID=5886 RepID=A0A8S1MKU0_PARPR|nr:unnamed protein product [Paramecium primaurelia]